MSEMENREILKIETQRRHHNNKGYRQIRRGKTRDDIKRLRKKYLRRIK